MLDSLKNSFTSNEIWRWFGEFCRFRTKKRWLCVEKLKKLIEFYCNMYNSCCTMNNNSFTHNSITMNMYMQIENIIQMQHKECVLHLSITTINHVWSRTTTPFILICMYTFTLACTWTTVFWCFNDGSICHACAFLLFHVYLFVIHVILFILFHIYL